MWLCLVAVVVVVVMGRFITECGCYGPVYLDVSIGILCIFLCKKIIQCVPVKG